MVASHAGFFTAWRFPNGSSDPPDPDPDLPIFGDPADCKTATAGFGPRCRVDVPGGEKALTDFHMSEWVTRITTASDPWRDRQTPAESGRTRRGARHLAAYFPRCK